MGGRAAAAAACVFAVVCAAKPLRATYTAGFVDVHVHVHDPVRVPPALVAAAAVHRGVVVADTREAAARKAAAMAGAADGGSTIFFLFYFPPPFLSSKGEREKTNNWADFFGAKIFFF